MKGLKKAVKEAIDRYVMGLDEGGDMLDIMDDLAIAAGLVPPSQRLNEQPKGND